MKNRKLIGMLAFFTAIGMLLVILITSRLAILILLVLLMFFGYICYMD